MAAIFHADSAEYIGYHGYAVNLDTSYLLIDRRDISTTGYNISIALNMIPVIGNLIAGIMHIVQGVRGDGDSGLIVRGIVECTIIGGLALVPLDIIFTVGRMCTTEMITLDPFLG